MKKIVALLLALVMVLALCACTPQDPNVGPASNPGTETTPGGEQPSQNPAARQSLDYQGARKTPATTPARPTQRPPLLGSASFAV